MISEALTYAKSIQDVAQTVEVNNNKRLAVQIEDQHSVTFIHKLIIVCNFVLGKPNCSSSISVYTGKLKQISFQSINLPVL